MKDKSNLFIFGSIILIFLGIVLVAIVQKNAPGGTSTDVRARAVTQNTLKITGIVYAVDEVKGIIQVTNVQFDDTSRAGAPQNLGDWTITPPMGFNFASVSPGVAATIGVNASTFNIASHEVTAITLTVGN